MASLNHAQIEVPMVPRCPECNHGRIHWHRKEKRCTCLNKDCKHQWAFFPANEPSVQDLNESIIHLDAAKAYYSALKGEDFFQSEKKQRMDRINELLTEIEQLSTKRDGADKEIEWCEKQKSNNQERIAEINGRVRATTDLIWADANPTKITRKSEPKGKTKQLAESVYNNFKAASIPDEMIYQSLGLVYGKDTIELI